MYDFVISSTHHQVDLTWFEYPGPSEWRDPVKIKTIHQVPRYPILTNYPNSPPIISPRGLVQRESNIPCWLCIRVDRMHYSDALIRQASKMHFQFAHLPHAYLWKVRNPINHITVYFDHRILRPDIRTSNRRAKYAFSQMEIVSVRFDSLHPPIITLFSPVRKSPNCCMSLCTYPVMVRRDDVHVFHTWLCITLHYIKSFPERINDAYSMDVSSTDMKWKQCCISKQRTDFLLEYIHTFLPYIFKQCIDSYNKSPSLLPPPLRLHSSIERTSQIIITRPTSAFQVLYSPTRQTEAAHPTQKNRTNSAPKTRLTNKQFCTQLSTSFVAHLHAGIYHKMHGCGTSEIRVVQIRIRIWIRIRTCTITS